MSLLKLQQTAAFACGRAALLYMTPPAMTSKIMESMSIEDGIKAQAQKLGFELVGIAAATDAESYATYHEWIQQGYAGEMRYLERYDAARQHPKSVFTQVRSLVVVGMNYKPAEADRERDKHLAGREGAETNGTPVTPPVTGKVARYAFGVDYHELMWRRLDQLLAWIQIQLPGSQGRGVVDTAPLLERDFARRAGLGWFGKNTMVINKHLGSYFFLGALLLDIELRPDPPHTAQHCGTCTACLDACPTDAFIAPGSLDSRRCISYLTIELRGPIPNELREPMDDWVFGCDVCQEVCPWNRKSPAATLVELRSVLPTGAANLVELLEMSEDEFRRRFRHTALWRPRWNGVRRNAAIALGNLGDPAATPALERAARDPDEVVRDAATWALGRLGLSVP
jgi:epoxyqueuosine reductase